MRLDWPMAAVVVSLAAVAGALQWFGRLPDSWAGGVATLFVLVAGGMRSFLVPKGGDE